MADKITNYKCPACTGPLHFAGASQNLECEYCGSSFSVQEVEEFYAAKNASAEDAFEKPEDEWEQLTQEFSGGEGMKVYKCPSCTAELVFDENTAATSCPYCGNPTVVPGQFSGVLKPDFIIPFKLEKAAAVEALKNHYGNKFLLPKAFKEQNHIEDVKGVYVPFWLYDGVASGDMVYEASNSRTERKGDEEITTTKYYRVERKGTLAFEKIPADASSKMPDDLMDSIEPFDYKDLGEFSKAYLAGYMADKYDVSSEECSVRAVARAKASTKQALRDDIKGFDSVTERSGDVSVRQGKVSYAIMPVWLLNTKWNGNNYLFAMNGQTGKLVGDLPEDKGKAFMSFLIPLIALFALFKLVIGMEVIPAVVIALIIAGVIIMVLKGQLKSVATATRADRYTTAEGVHITHRDQQYTHEDVTRRQINSEN